MTNKPNNKGRPPKNIVKPIHDTAENVAKVIMNRKPKKEWDYLKKK